MVIDNLVLKKLIARKSAAAEDTPNSSARAFETAVAKTSQTLFGIAWDRGTFTETAAAFSAISKNVALEGGYCVLTRDANPVGFMFVDQQIVAAIIEMLANKSVSKANAPDRLVTSTDMMLVLPFLSELSRQLGLSLGGSPLAEWFDELKVASVSTNLKSLCLTLSQNQMTIVNFSAELDEGGRTGTIGVALPQIKTVDVAATALSDDGWPDKLEKAVYAAPAKMDAVLHKFQLSIGKIESLQVGQVIPLHGCNVGDVRLLMSGKFEVAKARLGQSKGLRAVRIEKPTVEDLTDIVLNDTPKPIEADQVEAAN